MYYQIVRQCALALENLEHCLDKAQQFAASKKFDVNVLLYERLAPDMYPFMAQVQAACDYGKAGAAVLSGRTPPRHEDSEQTIDDARARLRKTVAFMREIGEHEFEGAGDRLVTLRWRPSAPVSGEEYALQVTFSNVYFHVGMAYAILRKSGVDVGKLDFLGEIYRHEA